MEIVSCEALPYGLIPVNGGSLFAKVSFEDFERLFRYTWVLSKRGEPISEKRIFMRRLVGGTKTKFISNDKLDCRRSNFTLIYR